MHFSIRYVLKVKVHHDAWNDFTGTRTGKASVEIWKPLLNNQLQPQNFVYE